MSKHQGRSRRSGSLPRWSGVVARVAAAIVLLGVVLTGGARESEAKLDPYYVLRGQSLAQFKPRVLIAMDTSGSMTWTVGGSYCTFGDCEGNNNSSASRISLARKAINDAISQAQGQADFAFMTFDHRAPPTSSGQVPSRCSDVYDYGGGGGDMGDTRFFWVNLWTDSWNNYTISDIFGGTRGTWVLCGSNRPFPYLRYDDAIRGVTLPNNETTPLWNGETVPEGPLAPKITSWNNYWHANNARRKVQFFPRFLGQRVRMDCSDPELSDMAGDTYGDYGNGVANNGQVCGRTFYYWPYVDGYPGYSHYDGVSTRMRINGCYQSCSWFGGCSRTCSSNAGSRTEQTGVAERDGTDEGTLWAPFYSEAAQSALNGAAKGPLNRDRANLAVLGMTGKMTMGGVDATGGTPLVDLIGNVDSYVTFSGGNISGTTGSYSNSNAPFQHKDMASYLSFVRRISPNDVCVPTYAIVISDGEPNSSTNLYSYIRKLRNKLDVKTYAVGFGSGVSFTTINNMACAAAGSGSTTLPCTSSTSADNWDTCRVPGDKTNCGYTASNPQELSDALFQIIDGAIETDLPTGPVATTNEFVASSTPGDIHLFQTNVGGYTESPEFKGHVTRASCDTQVPVDPSDPDCADPLDPAYNNCALTTPDYCLDALNTEPPHAGHANGDFVDANEQEDFAEGGSTCTWSRDWDAGECLRQRSWQSRRIYTYDSNGNVYRISDNAGNATSQFRTALINSGAVSTSTEANAVTRFLLGQNLPDSWKLPGLATATPVVIRRIPEKDENLRPSIGIRDPHCSGRRLDGIDDVPKSLQDFSVAAETQTTSGFGLGTHREYQEAVLVGSDFGLLHAFHFDTGNELFALLPPSMYQHIADLQANGTANFGQTEDLANHQFGIASTINQGWAYDPNASKWRHLAVVGMGPGGRDIMVLDVAHMGLLGNNGVNTPVEVLWTTETLPGPQGTLLRATLGETWSRPALTYKAPNHNFIQEPEAYLVFGSGYDEINSSAQPWRGQALHLVDAITGQTYTESAYFPEPPSSQMLEAAKDYSITMDAAVSTHCQSRYWGDAEEMYVADVSGRLYRWDLGSTGNGTSFDHQADSGGKWTLNGNQAQPLFRFGACLSTNEFSCNVSGTVGDFFIYPPAVISSDRIDEPPPAAPPPGGGGLDPSQKDQFLIAMVSGSVSDDKVDGGDKDNPFHSSLYIMVDDHQGGPYAGGLSVPGSTGSVTAPGANTDFMRLPLNQINRERRWTYADGSAGYESRAFSKKARPTKAPFIRVSLPVLVDTTSGTPEYQFDDLGGNVGDIELYEIVFTIYEPGEQTCDPRWRNPNTNQWEFDQGSTYEIRFFLSAKDGNGFDLVNGAGSSASSLFGGNPGLSGPVVSQIPDQGFQTNGTANNVPCTEDPQSGTISGVYSMPIGVGEVDGFSPREVTVP